MTARTKTLRFIRHGIPIVIVISWVMWQELMRKYPRNSSKRRTAGSTV